MRPRRTVRIKMSSATAWTGSMTTLHFVAQPANCSTLLWPQLQRSCPPKQLEVRWTDSVLVSAERFVLAVKIAW